MRKILTLLLLGTIAASAAPLQKETIADGFHDPMSMAPAPDGDVYVVEREGRILRIRPSTGGVFEVANMVVSARRASDAKSPYAAEDGLQGIALDPDFAKNQRVYLYYSHPEKVEDRLSRFTLRDGKLDLSTELVLIEVPLERSDLVCHHGGSVQFGPDGLLYLSIGDNTNPFESDGYAPIDNRPDRTPWDAERSAGNTNDLRGKVLRIRPNETGYDIPTGNLFPKGTAKTRPEIYAMGCRNPFRISIDPENSIVYWGEVGPDAGKESARGPAGHDEINQAQAAGNFGWPFLVANNKPYPIYDFASGKPGPMTDPAAPRNPGIRNTGLSVLPPAVPAFIWYPYAESPEFPIMGKGGRCAMAGPVFYHDPARKFNLLPKEDDHTLLIYEWSRGKIWNVKLGQDEKLQSLKVFDEGLTHPMDMEMAADGSLLILSYGKNWYFNNDGKLLRVLPPTTNHSPVIAIGPVAGKDRTFTVTSATDPDNDKLTVTWWLTTGATERQLGTGSTITLPAHEGSEIRAVATDGNSPPAVARLSLVKEKAAPELQLNLVGKPDALAFGQDVAFTLTSATAPTAAQVSVRARYIPATGHDAGGPQFSPTTTALVTANLCLACHQVDQNSVGPKYVNVALKYRGHPEALDYLKNKVKAGGKGVWGEVPMPPQIALKDNDADTILRAILGLAEGVSEIKGSLNGTLQLAPKPANAEPGGAWEFTAEVPGFASAKFRVAAK